MRASLAKSLRRAFLRGPALSQWLKRRSRQWEEAYVRQLMHAQNAPAIPVRDVKASGILRNILFIADCMWEQDTLVPDLASIAQVTTLDLAPYLKSEGEKSTREAVAAAIESFTASKKKFEPEVILFYARPALLSDEAFHHLRQRWSCPLVGMNLDDRFEFFPYSLFSGNRHNYQHWAAKFDLNLTNCLPATEWYRQRGFPCLYCPPGVHIGKDPSMPTSADFKYEISFLGSMKPERQVVIGQLLEAGLPIQLFGSGWPDSKWVDKPDTIFRETQINLGIGFASPSLVLTTVKARDFECPGVGGCYLTTYNWELANLYEVGKEILCYRSVAEAIEIFSYYRSKPQECLKIAQAAWRRCSNEHSWKVRFRRVFSEMGFKLQ